MEDPKNNPLIQQRLDKLEALREAGINPFPNDFRPTHTAAQIVEAHGDADGDALEALDETFAVAGRVMAFRSFGKAAFVKLQDRSGAIQAYVRRDAVGTDAYRWFKRTDVGDYLGVVGTLMRTRTGELTVDARQVRLLTKSLRPLPEKWHGLTDKETRYRQRYVDLVMSPKVRETFRARARIVQLVRGFFQDRDFVELETPMMQPIPGGATARPFVTHHNALDMTLYLRVAPELYLKRLVVGGFERVFEINRNFRNEGLSTRHNPEFTMLEFYQAYADYRDLMDLTEEMLRLLARMVLGKTTVTWQGNEYDFGSPFARMTVKESILHFNPDIRAEQIESLEEARKVAAGLGIPLKESWGLGKVQIEIFEKTVEHRLEQPTFITAYPTEVSPLARRNDEDPFVTDRFEFFVGGREIANGFTELNDAEDQAERFRKQVEEKERGDMEAMHYDEDYIIALEHGMPPTAGEGIGIDRLVMLFTDSASIRDVLLFPHMRPKSGKGRD